MENCLDELNLTYCLIYLDDVIVFSKTEKEHMQHLHVVFECFHEYNLKLKPSKCEFLHNKINHLAHHVSKEDVQPSKENLKAVAQFAPTSDLYWNPSLSGLGSPLPAIHQGICPCSTATTQTPIWRRYKQEEQVSDTHQWNAYWL